MLHIIFKQALSTQLCATFCFYRLCKTRAFVLTILTLFFSELLSEGHLKEFARTVEDWELSSRCSIVDEYRHKIPQLVRDIQKAAVEADNAEIVLTTAHKSKGLEFSKVRLADDFPKLVNNGKLITGEEFDIDEFNLIYVSITRAKERIMLSESLQEFTEHCSSYSNMAETSPDKPQLV
jgi:ATP-dependent exoDNAse (exonuclease V) beta subunit